MKTLCLFADCNGAGKTAAAYALLDCREFVNAGKIARGLLLSNDEHSGGTATAGENTVVKPIACLWR